MFFQAERNEIEVGLDFRAKEAAGVGKGRGSETRMNFLRDTGASDNLTAFEDQDLQAGLREIRGVDEPIVTPADDDRVHLGHEADGEPRLDKEIASWLS